MFEGKVKYNIAAHRGSLPLTYLGTFQGVHVEHCV